MTRGIPLWLRWLLTVAGFGAAAVVLIIVVGGSGNSSDGNAAELLRAGERVRSGVLHDQAPHSSKLHAGVPPAVGFERAIAADVRGRVRRKELAGPTRGVSCTAVDPRRGSRRPYRCTARVGAIRYPFFAVADLRTRRLTWCKFDQIPTGEGAVPLSPRCKR